MSSAQRALSPQLERVQGGSVFWYTDEKLRQDFGFLVAFCERSGGVSRPPFHSLNLAAHVGDDARVVDINRTILLEALGVSGFRDRLVVAEQVHGTHLEIVGSGRAGSGAYAEQSCSSASPVPATDALLTSEIELPLLMFYADCVPVILVATVPVRGIAVVHAGWRGALASLPGTSAAALCAHVGCEPCDLLVYIGPHIGHCCYEVDETLGSLFADRFDSVDTVEGHLDLTAVVRESLMREGVSPTRMAIAGMCTLDRHDRFYSYRAAAQTGRHGALAVIT